MNVVYSKEAVTCWSYLITQVLSSNSGLDHNVV